MRFLVSAIYDTGVRSDILKLNTVSKLALDTTIERLSEKILFSKLVS